MTAVREQGRAELTEPTDRVRRLRARALEKAYRPEAYQAPEVELAAARSWLRTGTQAGHILRRGILAGDILRALTPVIDPDELLVGKLCPRRLSPEEQAEVDAWRKTGEPATSKAHGQRAHMAIDYPRLLRLGVSGVRDLIEAQRARLDPSRPDDQEKDDFYRACLAALEGMSSLARRYADHAEALVENEADPARREELREIARVCRRVPEGPAETFREALQAVHFATFCMCAGNRMLLFQLGRPDRYLLPFYRCDVAAGRLTPEEAQELVDCLGLMLTETTPRGLAVGWMTGGRDESGLDATNELTYLFVRAAGHLRLAYPGVGLCWNRDTPPDLVDMACRLLARGCSHPALFNDDVITRGLLRLGLSHRDACQYIHSTCVEITPVGVSNVYVASPYYNLVQALHDALGLPPTGCEQGETPDIPTFEDLLARWKERMRALIREGVTGESRCMRSRAEAGGYPLLSCFVNDCLARGRDIDRGGARVNWVESSFVGLANLVDALAAIRQLVYEEGRLTLERLREALRADFQGHEVVRAMLARAPKYGNDDERADRLAAEVTAFLREECDRHRTYWGDAVVPGFFCWIMHEHLGRQTGASPDGRAAGFPLADGSGPAQGRERRGPTAMVRSATRWDHAPMIGGIAVNMRFTPGSHPDEIVPAMRGVLETFLQLGGFEAQVNVVDAATLRAAQERPEEHRDLVVRIAGYSDFFVGLSPEMQAEVIARSEHPL